MSPNIECSFSFSVANCRKIWGVSSFVLKIKLDLIFIQQPHPFSSLNIKLSGNTKIKKPDLYLFQYIKLISPLHLQGC